MAATWLGARARHGLDPLPSRLWFQVRNHLRHLQSPSPASLEIESMPYPTALPDTTVFESMSDEYSSVSAPRTHLYSPLSSSQTLVALVSQGDYQAAHSLRHEMVSHHIPIPHDGIYLRAAFHVLRKCRHRRLTKECLNTFEAWLSLVPDRDAEWHSFYSIRHRIFWRNNSLYLDLAYRFGLVLASKGYYLGDAAMQVVSALAYCAHPSTLERYLREVEDASRNYHTEKGTVPPSDLLVDMYGLSIRTVALAGKAEAALRLISMAHLRGIRIPDTTLKIAVDHAPDRNVAIDQIRALFPSWSIQHTITSPLGVEHKAILAERTADITVLAAHLRSLRTALRSHSPPSPHILRNFILSYQALGRTRALTLLRSLAFRHSPRSASTWVFTQMIHHRLRQEPVHLLNVFSQYFLFIGVPRKQLLSLLMKSRQDDAKPWVAPPRATNGKLWPSAYHTALVWEAVFNLSSRLEKERLYMLLLRLVRKSRQPELGAPRVDGAEQPKTQLPPNTYDAGHFSPFVSMWSRRHPARAASVLRDMTRLGVEPGMHQWSMVARGYAQHDDPDLALRILDHLQDIDSRGGGRAKDASWGMLLGVHTNVLRGFVVAEDVRHAREVARRLVDRFGYQAGDRPATDASLALLRTLEDRLGSNVPSVAPG